ARHPGFSKDDADFYDKIETVFAEATGKLFIVCSPTNVQRLQTVLDAAYRHHRKTIAIGRRTQKLLSAAKKFGFLDDHGESIFNSERAATGSDHEKAVILSGFRDESISSLIRQSRNPGANTGVKTGDTVVMAVDPTEADKAVDGLLRIGARVYPISEGKGEPGHGYSEDLKLMLRFMNPKYFMPVHGEYRMLKAHADLAEQSGVPRSQIFIAENGERLEFANGEAEWGGKAPSGKVLVDGNGVGDIGNIVLRDRKLLSEDGVLLVVVTLVKKTKQILSGPEIVSRGFVYVRESEGLIREAGKIVSDTMNEAFSQNVSGRSSIKRTLREALGRYFFEQTRRNPMILPII
ncbi:MAG TPA: ribonuclease J, partial [Bacillales bacterium]|nr:ribonuclease J [Bacillales bacterium]